MNRAAAPRGATALLTLAALGALLALADAKGDKGGRGVNVHRADADCRVCHTLDAAALRADRGAARDALAPDQEARCNTCHGAEGPSHRTGMAPKHAPPPALLLARDGHDGRIMCATCHYMHGEPTRAQAFERIDNKNGQLCLSCHTLAELQ